MRIRLLSSIPTLGAGMHVTRWKLASFDLDGTLVRHISTGQHIAACLGHGAAMAEIEGANAAGTITNADTPLPLGRGHLVLRR